MRGVIRKGVAGFYYVDVCEDGDGSESYECKARGIFRLQGIIPLAGDFVEISLLEDGTGSIDRILPRKNSFDRPPVANVDCMVLIAAARHPDPNFATLDRFIAAAEAAEVETIICVNKTDLADAELLARFSDRYGAVYRVCFVCGKSGEGIETLRPALLGKRAVLAGPSGAGKSTISNLLLGERKAAVGEISRRLRRGKNTTRTSELFQGDGFQIFDTPGFTSFELSYKEPEKIARLFPEFRKYLGKCGFSDCRHLSEPGCAVTKAVNNGHINSERYDSYVSIYKEAEANRKY